MWNGRFLFYGVAGIRHERGFFTQHDGPRGVNASHGNALRRNGTIGLLISGSIMTKIVIEDIQRRVVGILLHHREAIHDHIGHIAIVAEIVGAVVAAAEHGAP